MTPAADDRDFEDAFAAILAGRPVPSEAAGLAAFSRAVRSSATQPGRPNAALAELLTTGLLTDQSSPSARTASSAGMPPAPAAPRVRIRRRFPMILTALVAKLLSAGAVAQAATGAGIAVVVVTGVGAAGALPADLQTAFSSVAGIGAQDDEPATGGTTEEIDEEKSAEEVEPQPAPAAEDPVETPEQDASAEDEDAEDYRNFGAEVSDRAHEERGPGEHGEWVRANAPGHDDDRRQERTAGSEEADEAAENAAEEAAEGGSQDTEDEDAVADEKSEAGTAAVSGGKGGRGRS